MTQRCVKLEEPIASFAFFRKEKKPERERDDMTSIVLYY